MVRRPPNSCLCNGLYHRFCSSYPQYHTSHDDSLLHQPRQCPLHRGPCFPAQRLQAIFEMQAFDTIGVDRRQRGLPLETRLLRHNARTLSTDVERAKGSRVDLVQSRVVSRLLPTVEENVYQTHT